MTNLALPLFIQASGDLALLGQFAVATIPQGVAVAIARAMAGQTVLRGQAVRGVPKLLPCLVVLAALAASTSVLLVGLLNLQPYFYCFALAAPLSMIQDVFRYRSFGVDQQGKALLDDTVWAATFLGAVCAAVVVSSLSPEIVVYAYTAGAGVATLLAVAFWPKARRHVEGSRSSLPIFIEASSIFVVAQLSQIVAAVLLPVTVLGIVRSAMTLATPIGLSATVAQSLIVPRIQLEDRIAVRRASIALFVMCTILGIVTLLAVTTSSPTLLGALGFSITSDLIATFAVTALGLSLGAGVTLYLIRVRVFWATRNWLFTRIGIALVEPLLTLPLAIAAGPAGLASSAATSNGLMVARILVSKGRDRRGRR